MREGASSASRGSHMSTASTGGRRCSNAWSDCWRTSVDNDQRHRHERVVAEGVGADFHPADRRAKTDNQKHKIAERLLDVGFRWLGTSARMRMIGADDSEALRLRRVDPATAADLGEVVNRRDFVPPCWICRAIAAGNGFEYVGSGFSRTYSTRFNRTYRFRRPLGATDEQAATFIRGVTPRVRDDRRQRFAIDSDVRQPGPR